MKILFYNHTGKVSGAEKMVLLILKRLDRDRFAPLLVCPATGPMKEEAEKFGVPGRIIDQLEARYTLRPDRLVKYLFSVFRTFRQLRKEIGRARPDLIHANSVRSGLVATIAGCGTGIPVIWHLHDELPSHPLSTLIRGFAALSRRTRLMPVSNATAKSFRGRLLRYFGKNLPEQVVHNGIETDEFAAGSESRPHIRREFGLGDDELVFGIIGQITPRKGQAELLPAFARSLRKLPRASLLIVGEPMFNQDHLYLEELKRKVRELKIADRVIFTGQRPDVPEIMRALDVLVINSRSEALVIVAIEAMAGGTPVIATDVGGTSEIVRHKSNGWLIPFGNEDVLTGALVTVGRNPELRRMFSREGQKIVNARLTAGHFISRVEAFYEKCFAGESRPFGETTPAHLVRNRE